MPEEEKDLFASAGNPLSMAMALRTRLLERMIPSSDERLTQLLLSLHELEQVNSQTTASLLGKIAQITSEIPIPKFDHNETPDKLIQIGIDHGILMLLKDSKSDLRNIVVVAFFAGYACSGNEMLFNTLSPLVHTYASKLNMLRHADPKLQKGSAHYNREDHMSKYLKGLMNFGFESGKVGHVIKP